MSKLRRVAVFCGSSDGVSDAYEQLATEVGSQLAEDDIGVVYGGGNSGLMGAVARAAMAGGGHVTGVLPSGLFDNGITGDDISELELVSDMHARKTRMYELSDGFIGLPGGMGTFEELFEAATWSQLGLHADGRRKPVVLLDTNDYWQPVVDLLDRAAADGFMAAETRAIVHHTNVVEQAISLASPG